MSLQTVITRILEVGAPKARILSTQANMAVQKLQEFGATLEESVTNTQSLDNSLPSLHNNYSREIPSRYKQDIAQAAMDESGAVGLAAVAEAIHNIGQTHRLSHSDLEVIFSENGGSSGPNRMLRIL